MSSLSRQNDSAQRVSSLEMSLKVLSGRFSRTAHFQHWDMGLVAVRKEVVSHSQSVSGEGPWQECNPRRHQNK